MNKLKLILIMFLLTITSTLYTSPVYSANVAATICEYVASDDKKRLRSFLKSKKLKLRRIFDQIQCNSQNLLEFAVSSGSVETGSLMISKLPKKVVSENLNVLQGGDQAFIDAANKRIGN